MSASSLLKYPSEAKLFRMLLSRLYKMRKRAAILVVNGGSSPEQKEWLDLCLTKIKEHTKRPSYTVYVWNNNIDDANVSRYTEKIPGTRLIHAPRDTKLAHIHAVPLQKLYEEAKKDGVKYIVTMDTDAFPITDNWLKFLLGRLDKKTVVAGVWRDELRKGIEPYIHPSCLCTTVGFIEKHNIRLDLIDHKAEKRIDTLSHLTDIALKNNKEVFRLRRDNVNQLHYLMGGIYGGLIYHHSAGSRKHISFWGEKATRAGGTRNMKINEALHQMLFRHNREFIDWLMGKPLDGRPDPNSSDSLFIFSSHREPANILAQTLESNRRGNTVTRIDEPRGISQIASDQQTRGSPPVIAVYTNPRAILRDASDSGTEDGDPLEKWISYYSSVVDLHRRFSFPIIKIDPVNPAESISELAGLSMGLGLDPDLRRISEAVRRPIEDGRIKHDGSLPSDCAKAFEYLDKHRLRILPGSFEYNLLRWKEDLLEADDEEKLHASDNIPVF